MGTDHKSPSCHWPHGSPTSVDCRMHFQPAVDLGRAQRLSCFCELSLRAQFHSCNSPFKNLPRAIFLSWSSVPTWISFILSGVFLSSFLSPYLFSLPDWLAWKKFTKALPCDLVFLSQSCWPENSSVIWILTPSAHAGVLSCQFLCFFCTLSAELLLHALSCAQLSSSQGQVPTVRTHCCVSSIFFPADNHICSAPKMEEGCYFFFHVKGTWGKVTLRWEFVSSVLCTRERSCQVYVVDWNTDIWSHP